MALKRSTKIVLSVAAGFIMICVGVAGYGAWKIFSFYSEVSSYVNKAVPTELSEPRIFVGNGFLSRKEILKKSEKSFSEIILKGAAQNEEDRDRMISIESAKSVYGFSDVKLCGNDVVAAGEFGAYVVDLEGNPRRFVAFERLADEIKILFWTKKIYRDTNSNLRIFDIDGDGLCEFYSNAPGDGFTLFGSDGRVMWRYRNLKTREYLSKDKDEPLAWVTDVSTADLNDDGKEDLILVLNKEGIRAFTTDQRELWFRSGDFSSEKFQLLDVDNDQKAEIVNFIGAGSELMEKSTGKLIRKFPLPPATDGLIPIALPNGKLEHRLAGMNDTKFTVYDISGNEVFATDAPLSEVKGSSGGGSTGGYSSETERIYQPLVSTVSLKADREKFFVVLGNYIGIPRSQLYIYDSKGKLVYHEMLDEEAEAITTLDESSGKQGFIVAGKDTVWCYSAN